MGAYCQSLRRAGTSAQRCSVLLRDGLILVVFPLHSFIYRIGDCRAEIFSARAEWLSKFSEADRAFWASGSLAVYLRTALSQGFRLILDLTTQSARNAVRGSTPVARLAGR